MQTCVIINRNYPPQSGMTGASACELVNHLQKSNTRIYVVTLSSNYDGGGFNLSFDNNIVIRVKSIYNGKNKYFRLFSSLLEGFLLVRKAKNLKPNIIISLTDPPLLNFWVAFIANRLKINWLYWSMDLYPEAFASANLVSVNNIFYKLLYKYLIQNRPHGVISLGSQQLCYLESLFGKFIFDTILPSGVHQLHNVKTKLPHWKKSENKIIFGYIGNIGEAHDVDFIKTVIDCINPEYQTLILSVYGSKSKTVLNYCQSKPGILIFSKIPFEHLPFIDVHIVTLLSDWNHVCVPSKAYTAVSLGCALLLNCCKHCDLYEIFKDVSWHYESYNYDSIKLFFRELCIDEILLKRNLAIKLSADLNNQKKLSFEKISNYLSIC